jgi:hypothetical protein
MKTFYLLFKLMAPLLVVMATTAAYARPGAHAQPGLSCADWRLESNGWLSGFWHPTHEVTIRNVTLGTNVYIDQNANYIIGDTNIIDSLNRNCRQRRSR